MSKYTSRWMTESQGEIRAPHDVRLAVITEVQAHCVKLDDGELYPVPPGMQPVKVGQRVIARVPRDGIGYIIHWMMSMDKR